MLDRLLTRIQLIKQTIVSKNEENKCTFCAGNNEELLHLLFHCNFFFAVSQQIQVWTDSVGLDEADSIDHFLKCYKLWIRKIEKNKLYDNVMVWCLWRTRNDCIFKYEKCVISDVVFSDELL